MVMTSSRNLPPSGRAIATHGVADFKSEWPRSNRNRWPVSFRNQWPACSGISKLRRDGRAVGDQRAGFSTVSRVLQLGGGWGVIDGGTGGHWTGSRSWSSSAGRAMGTSRRSIYMRRCGPSTASSRKLPLGQGGLGEPPAGRGDRGQELLGQQILGGSLRDDDAGQGARCRARREPGRATSAATGRPQPGLGCVEIRVPRSVQNEQHSPLASITSPSPRKVEAAPSSSTRKAE